VFTVPLSTNEREIVMSTNTKSTARCIVALTLEKPVSALITQATNFVTRMTGNSYFPTPTPNLALITTAIGTLQTAEVAAVSRVKGAVPERNQKRKELVALLQQLRGYVQTVADADEANAPAIIESAGLSVRKKPTRAPRVFAAKQGPNSGVAEVVAASAAHRASYDWQYSADGGKTWVMLTSTLKAKTTVTGLTPGAVVQFKYRAVTKSGATDWSQAVSLTML
jgi:hypothetical protein